MNEYVEMPSTDQLPLLNRSLRNGKKHPDKIIQFGTGNFLKGFVNWIVQQLNDRTDLDAGIVAVKLRRGNEAQIDDINVQDGLFTLNVRGLEKGFLVDSLELVRSQNRALSPYQDFQEYLKLAEIDELQWIVSNTTEAGIRYEPLDTYTDSPAESFPAKLTQLLYRRYCVFRGDAAKGVRVFCCELIDNNAVTLKEILLKYAVLWKLEPGFMDWLNDSCVFCNTLVDRIVTGKPQAKRSLELQQTLGYSDKELIETEHYYQWVIETTPDDEQALRTIFPESAGLNIILTPDLTLYRQRKVRILNGAHTATVSLARLLNIETVYGAMQDEDVKQFMEYLLFNEICPTIALPEEDVKAYANAILERFANPFLHHEWTSIGLNSLSKWQARLLPVLKDAQEKNQQVPVGLAASLASLFLLYRGEFEHQTHVIQDDGESIQLIQHAWQSSSDIDTVVTNILSSTRIWGEDLSSNQLLIESISTAVLSIQKFGLREYINQLIN